MRHAQPSPPQAISSSTQQLRGRPIPPWCSQSSVETEKLPFVVVVIGFVFATEAAYSCMSGNGGNVATADLSSVMTSIHSGQGVGDNQLLIGTEGVGQ